MTKEERESYLDDVQILRDRNMTIVQIAQALNVNQRQVSRWSTMLRRQRRWRINVYESKPRDARVKGDSGRWVRSA